MVDQQYRRLYQVQRRKRCGQCCLHCSFWKHCEEAENLEVFLESSTTNILLYFQESKKRIKLIKLFSIISIKVDIISLSQQLQYLLFINQSSMLGKCQLNRFNNRPQKPILSKIGLFMHPRANRYKILQNLLANPHKNSHKQLYVSNRPSTVNKSNAPTKLEGSSCEYKPLVKFWRRLTTNDTQNQYQEKTENGNYNRSNGCKNKFLINKKSNLQRNPLRFYRTQSVGDQTRKNSRMLSFNCIQQTKPNWSNQSKQRILQTRLSSRQPTHLKKTKIKLELNLLSNNLSRQSTRIEILKPKISTISPSVRSKNTIKYNLLESKNKQKMRKIALTAQHKIFAIRSFEAEGCRPWSAVKEEVHVASDFLTS